MQLHSSVRKVGLSKIVEVSEAARLAAPDYEKRTGKPFIYFQRGEVGFATPPFVVAALHEAVEKGLTKYPKSGGEPWFKSAVIDFMKESEILDLRSEHVLCTCGGQEALQLVFNAFRGSRVTGFGPTWSCMLENIFPYSECTYDPVPLKSENGFAVNFDEVERKLQTAKLFYLNTPHNPTGKVFSAEEIERLCALCLKHDALLVSDEAYKDIVFDDRRHVSPLTFPKTRVYTACTFSKALAATGFRIGYALCRDEDLIAHLTRAEYTQTAGVATPIQYAFAEALKRADERRLWLKGYVEELAVRGRILHEHLGVHPPQGAFYCFVNLNASLPQVPDRDAYVQDLFMNNGIALVPGSAFGLPYSGHVRLSFSALSRELVKEGASRFTEVVQRAAK